VEIIILQVVILRLILRILYHKGFFFLDIKYSGKDLKNLYKKVVEFTVGKKIPKIPNFFVKKMEKFRQGKKTLQIGTLLLPSHLSFAYSGMDLDMTSSTLEHVKPSRV
jgi:hypothetical protein